MRQASFRGLTRMLLCVTVLSVLTSFASANSRPFKLSGITLLTPREGNTFSWNMDGAGTGTHLGNWTNTGVFVLEPKNGQGTGVVDLVAANGDHLFFTSVGSADPYGQITAIYTITGGTGRFEDASGSGDFLGQLAPDISSITYTVNGTIDY